MAKKKFFDAVKLETESKEPEKVVEVIDTTIPKVNEPEEKTVIGIAEAEKLQKSGWQLVSVTQESDNPYDGKTYKFRKE